MTSERGNDRSDRHDTAPLDDNKARDAGSGQKDKGANGPKDEGGKN